MKSSMQVKDDHNASRSPRVLWFVVILLSLIFLTSIIFEIETRENIDELFWLNPLSSDYFSKIFDISFSFSCNVVIMIFLNVILDWIKDHNTYKGLTVALFYEEHSLWIMCAVSFFSSCLSIVAYGKGWDTVFTGSIYTSLISGAYSYVRLLVLIIHDHPSYGESVVKKEFESLIQNKYGTVQITCAYIYKELAKNNFSDDCKARVSGIIKDALPDGDDEIRCLSQFVLEIITMYVQKQAPCSSNSNKEKFISIIGEIVWDNIKVLCDKKKKQPQKIKVWMDNIQKCICDNLSNVEGIAILSEVIENVERSFDNMYYTKYPKDCFYKYIKDEISRTKEVIVSKIGANKRMANEEVEREETTGLSTGNTVLDI